MFKIEFLKMKIQITIICNTSSSLSNIKTGSTISHFVQSSRNKLYLRGLLTLPPPNSPGEGPQVMKTDHCLHIVMVIRMPTNFSGGEGSLHG